MPRQHEKDISSKVGCASINPKTGVNSSLNYSDKYYTTRFALLLFLLPLLPLLLLLLLLLLILLLLGLLLVRLLLLTLLLPQGTIDVQLACIFPALSISGTLLVGALQSPPSHP